MRTDVVIIGGGPAGAACSLFLEQKGIESVIVERSEFPRYHIGESMTGECGNCVRQVGLEAEMLKRSHPVKWGVSVYGPRGENPFYVPVQARTQDGALTPASTWQVRRSDFDSMLLDTALSRGSELLQGEAISPLRDGDRVAGVRVRTRSGAVEDVNSSVVVDASGIATFLCQAGVTGRKDRGKYDNQVAIFSQVTGAIRDDGKEGGDTLIFYQQKNRWAWFIPLDDDVVSVGIVVPASYFASRRETKRAFLTRELHELNPELKRRVPEISLTEEVRAVSNYSYEIRDFAGPGYLCLGDAHRFIDPVFSFGLFFAMKEAEQSAEAIHEYLTGSHQRQGSPFAAFAARCNVGMDTIQHLIDAFWNEPLAFAVFVHSRFREDCIDMFAGRVYMDTPSAGLRAFQQLNSRGAQPLHHLGT